MNRNHRLLPLSIVAALAGWLNSSQAAETRDLILVAGQSNSVGYDAYASELPPDAEDKATLFWFRVGDPPPDKHDVTSARQWTFLQPQPKGSPMTPAEQTPVPGQPKIARQYGNFAKPEGGFGPEIGLVRALRAAGEPPLAVVKVAFSGTAVKTDWDPRDPGPNGACYRAIIEEAKAAIADAAAKGITLKLRAFVWVQGESDATAAAAREYETNLTRMITHLRTDLGAPGLRALLGVNTRFGNGRNPYMPTVIAAQRAIAAKDPRVVYVNTAGAQTLPPSHTHFTAAGTLEVGRRFAAALR